MEKYSKHIFRQIQANIEDITAEDLEATATMTADSAAGMDQWALGDINMLSKEASKVLATMMHAIERGNPWPEQLENTRAAFLAKDPEDMLNPLADRLLLMLPSVYRMWSKTRLRHLQPWIATWSMSEMFA